MEEHIQVAIGSILGDGSLKDPAKRTGFAQLYVSQRCDRLPYLVWLHAKLSKGFRVNPIKVKKGYNQFYFMTKPDGYLGYLRRKFYPEGKKIIPEDICNFLKHPLSLAVWYMDDGTLDKRDKYHQNALIATYGFSFTDCERLTIALEDNFGILSSVTKCRMRGKVYPRTYIKSGSMRRFTAIIKPFIHPALSYRLP